MPDAWTWLAPLGLGALHGMNPVAGWGWAAVCGVRGGSTRLAWHALGPIALGHAASVLLVAWIAVAGGGWRRETWITMAAALLAGMAALHLCSRRRRAPARATRAGLATWSFGVATLHGSGLMLVPALVPLCLGAGTGGDPGVPAALAFALAGMGLHLAGMLAVTGLLATLACRAWARITARRN